MSTVETSSVDAGSVLALATAHVLIVGDVMLDRFITGTVQRISPEAPVPVLVVERDLSMLGGAGNVLRNIAAFGASAALVAVIGDDGPGREVCHLMEEATSGGSRSLVVESQRPTTTKIRFRAVSQQLLRVDRERVTPLAETTIEAVLAKVEAALKDASVLVLSDYGKGVLSRNTIRFLIDKSRVAGRPVIVDPKNRDFSVYRGASLITPNRRELADATGMPTDTDEQVVIACLKVISGGIEAVLATRSEQGMTVVLGSGTVRHLPPRAQEVYDVSGAGDTVVAVTAAGLAAGLTVLEAAELANAAAGIVVSKPGTAVVQPDELIRVLQESYIASIAAKICNLATAVKLADEWRQKGLRIGFTNGCFDLLHPGHVSLLCQARMGCDRLIVGLNSDASVRRLKGNSRPAQSEMARATMLAALPDVERVIIFAEDTPEKLIRAIRPEVLFKGAEYAHQQVVGAEILQGYGGQVKLLEMLPGHSTTMTLKRMQAFGAGMDAPAPA